MNTINENEELDIKKNEATHHNGSLDEVLVNTPMHARPNLTYIKTFSGGDKVFERDIIESSISEMNEKLSELKRSLEADERDKIMGSSHSLKSLSSIVGSTQLHHIFKAMEDTAFTNSLQGLNELLINVEKVWHPFVASLEELLSDEY